MLHLPELHLDLQPNHNRKSQKGVCMKKNYLLYSYILRRIHATRHTFRFPDHLSSHQTVHCFLTNTFHIFSLINISIAKKRWHKIPLSQQLYSRIYVLKTISSLFIKTHQTIFVVNAEFYQSAYHS